jgi:hypothetical protein
MARSLDRKLRLRTDLRFMKLEILRREKWDGL